MESVDIPDEPSQLVALKEYLKQFLFITNNPLNIITTKKKNPH